MKLFYASGACSLGIHVLLEEIGRPYEAQEFNLKTQEQYTPAFTQFNPKSKVPTLIRDDGSVLTEYGAIALYLARRHPEAKLLPDDLESQIRATEAIDYAVGTVHMQGFARLFRPSGFAPSEADHDAVRARGTEIIDKGLRLMDQRLGAQDTILPGYSIADSALFYVTRWARALKLGVPGNVERHFTTMLGRPSVQRALVAERLPLA